MSATGKHTFGYVYGRAGRGSSVCGLHVDGQGRVYATFGSNECHVRVYDTDGKLVEFPRRQKITEGSKAAVGGALGAGFRMRVAAASLTRGGFGENRNNGVDNYNKDIWAARASAETP